MSPMPMGTFIPFTSSFNLNFSGEIALYLGSTSATSQPAFIKAPGREPATSASPPVLAKGTASEATSKTLSLCPRDALGEIGEAFFDFFAASRGILVPIKPAIEGGIIKVNRGLSRQELKTG